MEGIIIIRDAVQKDITQLAVLIGELGYPTTTDEMKFRFLKINSNPLYNTQVAEKNGPDYEMNYIKIKSINTDKPLYEELIRESGIIYLILQKLLDLINDFQVKWTMIDFLGFKISV